MCWEPKFSPNQRKFDLRIPIFKKKCKWCGVLIWSWRLAWNGGSPLDLELKKSFKWRVSGTKKKSGLKKGGLGTCPYYLSMWVPPGLDHFICWGIVPSTSYFLFVWVGTNRLVGRLAETYINQSLLDRSQWVVAIPSVIFFPDNTKWFNVPVYWFCTLKPALKAPDKILVT